MSKIKNKKIISLIAAVILVIAAVISELYIRKYQPIIDENGIANSTFSVHFIDVGQGDCTLIKSIWGNMLIDAGENGNEEKVLEYLKLQGIETLEYVVATHPHSDHIGGIPEVLDEFTVKNFIMPRLSKENTPTTVTYEKMIKSLRNNGATVIAAKPGNIYSFGEVYFEILAPFEQDENLNNMSVCLKLTYDGCSFMFTADAEKEVEQQIIDSGANLKAHVYKVAHHGSSTSNTAEFINLVSPDYAIISCAEDNSYGHPHDEVIETLNKQFIPYYSTAQYSTMIFVVEDSQLNFFKTDDSRQVSVE